MPKSENFDILESFQRGSEFFGVRRNKRLPKSAEFGSFAFLFETIRVPVCREETGTANQSWEFSFPKSAITTSETSRVFAGGSFA